MMSANVPGSLARFAGFELDLKTGELSSNGRKIRVHEQALRILSMLVARPGEVVTREEIRQALWPDNTVVEFENSMSSAVMRLRRAVGDSADDPHVIETIPRRGYRLIAAVEYIEAMPPVAPAAVSPAGVTKAVGRTNWGRGALLALAVAGLFLLLRFIVRNRQLPLGMNAKATAIGAIAVLPLEDFSADPSGSYFADGMTEELITRLAKVQSLSVISRTSAMRYKGVHKPLSVIAKELGSDAVVEGSITRSGGSVRIVAQLIDARTDRHLWSETYQREERDILALQSDIATEIARQVQRTLSPQDQFRLAQHRRIDPEAYDEFLKGNYFWNSRTEDGLNKALDHFRSAIEKDPECGPAYAGLANTYLLLGEFRLRPLQEVILQARIAAHKALALDPSLAEAQASLAAMDANELHRKEAEEGYRRALEISPGYATAHQWYAELLTNQGRFGEAIREIRRARDLDPLSSVVNAQTGWVLYVAGKFDESIQQYQKTLQMDRNFDIAQAGLGFPYEAQGRYEEAIAEFQKSADLSDGRPDRVLWLAQAHARAGHKQIARGLRTQLEEAYRENRVSPISMSILDLALDERESAAARLKQACADHRTDFMSPASIYEPLRADSRFSKALACLEGT
jgi:TolB-like protein/DNA-binding winged helix-turn-helix (wHTH) protein/Tfp pilus assembly protein PilF